jgi:hypothetical protein
MKRQFGYIRVERLACALPATLSAMKGGLLLDALSKREDKANGSLSAAGRASGTFGHGPREPDTGADDPDNGGPPFFPHTRLSIHDRKNAEARGKADRSTDDSACLFKRAWRGVSPEACESPGNQAGNRKQVEKCGYCKYPGGGEPDFHEIPHFGVHGIGHLADQLCGSGQTAPTAAPVVGAAAATPSPVCSDLGEPVIQPLNDNADMLSHHIPLRETELSSPPALQNGLGVVAFFSIPQK